MIVWGARYADTDAPAPVIKEMKREGGDRRYPAKMEGAEPSLS
jgi:hypothetical protein